MSYYNYKCDTHDQFILVNEDGFILETDSSLLSNTIGKSVSSIHPFFESLSALQQKADETYEFSAVHINLDDLDYIFDITFRTFKDDTNRLIILNNFTKLYDEYYALSQNKNESVISKEVIDLKNDLLIKKEKYKNRFLTNFSHTLKTPIHNLQGFSNLLEQTDLDLVQRNQLKVIQSTSDDLYAMINDILDISKIETGYFSVQKNSFNIHEVLKNLASKYQTKSAERLLEFNSNIDKGLPKFVIGDKFRLLQILDNILDNALNFTFQGSIDFNVSGKKNKNNIDITFSVKDTGIGISEDKQEAIFKSFYKINEDKDIKRPGLGLAMTKHLLDVMNGSIAIKSNENEGSIFEVNLNFKIAEDQIEPELKLIPLENKKANAKYRILVAEALETDQYTIKEIFNNTTDYQMDLVESGDDVIKQLQKENYDLVVLNIKIPTMDGFDTTRFIRHSEVYNFNRIPIIGVGGSFSHEEKEYCLEKEMNDYIGKPYNVDELMKKMKRLINKSSKN
ncbi:ATP-binding protein [Flaviramulus sp. BrNp1-15]|uniref:ATP-binding response regulator n=1 Tax=Flaviramulus sp. BrNp1-15 TaxID=2916754 RepID=UPI001EE80A55|nr:ATP-binding protein [Flaviramulus sp. BrNp1-15]ULC59850.1 ATP-binding protein [Flaviramulus sp. BrNp1-15]